MIGRCSILSVFWILFATQVSGSDTGGDNRSLRASVGGNLFGAFAKKMCRKTGDGVFDTISTSRFRFRANSIPGDMNGACSNMCKDLCPTSCYGSFKVDGGKCTCNALKCSGNAVCNSSKKCECRAGFNGNGSICCDTAMGLNFVDSGCFARPVAPIAPTAIVASPAGSPTGPGTSPSTPGTTPSTPGTTPATPGAAPVRAPVSGRRDGIAPKLVDFEVLSTNLVDVSAGSAKIDYKIKVEDQGSGVKSIVLTAYAKYRDVQFNKTLDAAIVGMTEQTLSLPLSPFVPQGIYGLHVTLVDSAGNMRNIVDYELAEKNFPYDFEVVNTKSENSPPALVGFAPLTPITVDPKASPKDPIVFQAKVSEDLSGVQSISATFSGRNGMGIYLYFSSYSAPQYRYDSVDFPLAGAAVLLNVTGMVYPGSPPGLYNLSFVEVMDAANARSSYNAANLTQMGLAQSITIVG